MEGLARDAELIGRGEAPPDRLERVREVGEVRAAMRAGVASLAAAEERMRLAIEGSGLATWELDPVADTILWSRHFPEMLGLPAGDAAPLPRSALIDRIHPDDAAALGAAWRAAEEEGGRFEAVFRIRRADDGSVRWLEAYGAWISSGPRRRFIGVTFDVTERHAADAQRRALMREVDHRAKNALAVVHSVVRLTRAKDGPSYAAAVEGRVRALARAHDLLARNHWEGVSLAALVADELAPRVASGQVALGGGDIRLPPEAVQPLSMVLHELATNAAAHGALSTAKGRVSLTWRVDPASGAVTLVWGERGGSPIAAPPVAGFGTRLIATTVEAQLGGSVAFDWAPEGLVCTLVLPAARLLVTKVPAAAPAGPAAPAGAGALAGKRVLVVEDEALIAAELALTLQDAGCATVGPAGTLAEGERLAGRPRTLDAAILDANLGGESSLPLARRLVAARVPVLVVTGYSELPAEWAAERGLAAVLRKPAEPGYLLEALRRAIEERLRAA
jgi:PAS domain S-box-containing protein